MAKKKTGRKAKARQKPAITAHDLYSLQLAGSPRLAPDGERVVYTVSRIDREKEKTYTDLWVASVSARPAPRRFTSGDQNDVHPRWSPDGTRIAFISKRGADKTTQLYVIPIDGGEAQRLTDLDGTVGGFAWSPDGKRLLLQFRRTDADAKARRDDPKLKERGVVCRHITRTFYKMDGVGFLPSERWHLWVVDARSGRAKPLTDGDRDEMGLAWSPDGAEVAFVSNVAKEPDLDLGAVELFVLDVASGARRKISTPYGEKSLPAFSPDGASIAYYATLGQEWWHHNDVWLAPARGRGKAKNLTAAHDFTISTYTLDDLVGIPDVPAPVFSRDGSRIFVQVAEHGRTDVRAVSVATIDGEHAVETVVAERGAYGAMAFDAACERIVGTLQRPTDPVQVVARGVAGGALRELTRLNRGLLGRRAMREPEEVWFEGADGNQLQGWILKPPGFRAGRKYPSILEIHGGPRTQYGHVFMHEFQYLAANGYVVYYCNPRGGIGYGLEHAKSIWSAWGTVDYADLMAFTDYMEAQTYIDADRMGVTGGSYGGYMSTWIIGHTDRFRAVVTQRQVSNLISMYGSSDYNWAFQQEFGDVPPWEGVEHYWEMSPIKHIGNAKTPTLVIHSEQDLRCDVEQAEQVYVALKRLGVPTELVRFPDSSHGLSRGGRTDRRIARLEHILRWFETHMKPRRKKR